MGPPPKGSKRPPRARRSALVPSQGPLPGSSRAGFHLGNFAARPFPSPVSSESGRSRPWCQGDGL
eukprot:3435155-Pyramimonas_sp.AAC.1